MQLKLILYTHGHIDKFWICKFFNYILQRGKKFLIFKVLKFILLYFKRLGLYIFFDLCEILFKLRPLIKLRLVKKNYGNKKLQVVSEPQILNSQSQKIKAMQWLGSVIKHNVDTSYFSFNFISEISDNIVYGFGKSIKKRIEYYSYAVNYRILKFYKWST